MKKTLAILLSLALVICMIPATASVAFAEGTLENVTIQSLATYTGNDILPNIELNNQALPDGGYTKTYVKNGEGGTVTPKGVGTYTVTVQETASPQRTATGTFIIQALPFADVEVSIPTQTGDITPSNLKDVVVYKDKAGNTLNLSKDITIAVTGPAEGSNTYSVSLTPIAPNVTGDAKTVLVDKLEDINGAGISPAGISGTASYTGKQITFEDAKLVLGSTDIPKENYQIRYEDNIHAGNAKIIFEGKKNYTGTKTVIFNITPVDVSKASLKIDDIGNQVITDVVKAATPSVVVREKIDGVYYVVDPDTYTVSYENNSAAGTNAKAKVVFKTGADFVGEISKTFTIVEGTDINSAATNITVSNNSNKTFNGSPQPATVKVNGLTEGTHYAVYYVSGSVRTKTPTNVGTYNIVLEGIGNYGGTKDTGKTLTITKANVSSTTVQGLASTYAYTGKAIEPDFTLNLGSYKLVKGVDYTVTYTNNTYNLSSTTYRPTITVTGTGTNFTGTKTMYFAIGEKSIYSCNISFADGRTSAVYTGNTIKPEVKVYENGILLTKGTHYSVTYKDAAGKTVYGLRDTGTYTVEVKGLNGYTGTRTLTFTITGTDISGYTVTLKESSVNATGYSQVPVITSVKKGYYYSLTSNDYTVSYQDATGKTVYSMSAPGTYRVVVTGKNGYSGSTYATFRIVGLPQTVTVTQDSYKVYDDSDVFKITAKATGDGTGFTYTSSNPAVASVSSTGYVTPNKVGRAVITVTTTGNKKYEPTSKQVVVKVYPDKAKLSKKPWTDGKASQLKVRWGYQDGVTKYQVRYSRDKNFRSGTYLTKTVKAHGKDYTTQSTTLSNLKRGYTYYIKVRAVYTDPVTGDNYYGSWSGWRSARTR